MTIRDLKKNNLIILECISGSRAYGLDTPSSDTDIKGVFILPKKEYYGLNYIPQISNSSNDIVYYELGRYLELLSVNNPNILELLNTPPASVLHRNPVLDTIDSSRILSKLCKNTFGKFAMSQIKKAKGLKKKIINPVGKERKTVLSFCYVNIANGSTPLLSFLQKNNLKQEHCGLVKLSNMKDIYALYYSLDLEYNGIIKNEQSNDIRLSSIPKGETQMALLYFNKDGYSKYCKEYKEYWSWVQNRNEERYQSTQSHGKRYDAKNMMHTFRLLEMAIEIAEQKQVNVKRPNREFLLEIKSGKYAYDELLAKAKEIQFKMEQAFIASDLPESPDLDYINTLAFRLRDELYTNGL